MIPGSSRAETDESAEIARTVFGRVVDDYRRVDLHPAEQALLARLRGEWPGLSMLDIGVGAGRTAYTFSAVAGRYVGIDYVPEMLEACRELVGEDERTSFHLLDARTLQSLGQTFDVVLFSFNGIDTLEHPDRLQILKEARAVVRDGGTFLFSSHSFAGLRTYLPVREVALSWSPRTGYHLAREAWRTARVVREKRRIDWGRMGREGWVMAVNGSHGFDLRSYFVTPREQVRQLDEVGFEVVEITDADGRAVDATYAGPSPWLNYLCRPVSLS